MTYPTARNAVGQYNNTAVQAGIDSATPHRLIQMLMEGALEKMARAKGFMVRKEIRAKGQHIGWAISIVEGLKQSLNKTEGGEVAQNLEDLYIYIQQRLMVAGRENDPAILDEVMSLMREIKAGWDAIADHVAMPPARSGTAGG